MDYKVKKYNTMKIEFKDEIAIVYFNRPEFHNAANIEMSYERLEIFSELSKDKNIRVLIITGNDKAYCAGGDLEAFSKFNEAEALEFAKRGLEYQKVLMDMPKPTIAAISGYAYGGGMENILLCDLRIASVNAKFALPEINVGIFPGGGGTQRLLQNISICKAKEMIFLGKAIDAATALNLGIINEVVGENESPLALASEWAQVLCTKPPLSIRAAKALMNRAWGITTEQGIENEIQMWASIFSTNDQKEGMNAFLEKRKPSFVGK